MANEAIFRKKMTFRKNVRFWSNRPESTFDGLGLGSQTDSRQNKQIQTTGASMVTERSFLAMTFRL